MTLISTIAKIYLYFLSVWAIDKAPAEAADGNEEAVVLNNVVTRALFTTIQAGRKVWQ